MITMINALKSMIKQLFQGNLEITISLNNLAILIISLILTFILFYLIINRIKVFSTQRTPIYNCISLLVKKSLFVCASIFLYCSFNIIFLDYESVNSINSIKIMSLDWLTPHIFLSLFLFWLILSWGLLYTIFIDISIIHIMIPLFIICLHLYFIQRWLITNIGDYLFNNEYISWSKDFNEVYCLRTLENLCPEWFEQASFLANKNYIINKFISEYTNNIYNTASSDLRGLFLNFINEEIPIYLRVVYKMDEILNKFLLNYNQYDTLFVFIASLGLFSYGIYLVYELSIHLKQIWPNLSDYMESYTVNIYTSIYRNFYPAPYPIRPEDTITLSDIQLAKFLQMKLCIKEHYIEVLEKAIINIRKLKGDHKDFSTNTRTLLKSIADFNIQDQWSQELIPNLRIISNHFLAVQPTEKVFFDQMLRARGNMEEDSIMLLVENMPLLLEVVDKFLIT